MARLRTPIGGTRSGILLVMQPDAFSRSCLSKGHGVGDQMGHRFAALRPWRICFVVRADRVLPMGALLSGW